MLEDSMRHLEHYYNHFRNLAILTSVDY